VHLAQTGGEMPDTRHGDLREVQGGWPYFTEER
jgi:hypothetical protein